MPSPSDSGNAVRKIDLRVAFLAISIVTFYFLFQLIIIFTSVSGLDGSCLYSFWTPYRTWWQNPYWLVVSIVSGLMVLSLFTLIDGLRKRGISKIVFGIVAITVLGLWLNGLNWLWKAMLFERGEIDSEVWYQLDRDRPMALLVEEPHVCSSGT